MTPDLVAVDWGTTSVRVWVLDEDGVILDEHTGEKGMGQLAPGDFAQVLEEVLSHLGVNQQVPVVICGMAGAAQGWVEAPYLPSDTDLSQLGVAAVRAPGTAGDVRILPGLKQMSPANVMRGEETQIAGFLSGHPGYSGVLCLPGTHAKWVRLAKGRIDHFRTGMTGELFALFSNHSVLRHSLGSGDFDEAAFADAVSRCLAHPQSVATDLFAIRAEGLLHRVAPGQARATLSGSLIGIELAATRDYWEGETVQVIGAASLAQRYATALEIAGATSARHDATSLTLAGLRAAGTQLFRSHA